MAISSITHDLNDEIKQITSYFHQKFFTGVLPVNIENIILQADVYREEGCFSIDLVKKTNYKMYNKSLVARFNLRKKCFEIIINSDEIPTRQRFAMSCGLGHIMLAHVSPNHHNKVVENIEFNNNSQRELEANFFACRLLMPENKIKFFMEKGKNIAGIAQCFNVSQETVKEYIRQMNLLNAHIHSGYQYKYIV